jgi:hypothetical protein
MLQAVESHPAMLLYLNNAQSDLPPEKWTPGYAAFASACSGVMYPIAECRRSRL